MCITENARVRPTIEVADILAAARKQLKTGPQEWKVTHRIIACRTAALGGHKLQCDTCKQEELSYNSCRDRHCPKCQYLAKINWISDRRQELLPVQYFHLVFTIPSELNPLFLRNKKICYDLLFKAMSDTLKQVAATRLKANIGFTAVLHTWGQTLVDHPHIHAIVPGGGLSFNDTKWISCKQGYFLPQKVLATVFRAKLIEAIQINYKKLIFIGAIEKYSSQKAFKSLLVEVASKDWIVYCKAPFGGPEQVIKYLGNYTHRIAISNNRIKSFDGENVSFEYRDRANEDKLKTMTLTVMEFARRFLLHVLPNRFVRIRHYGFLGKKNKAKKLKTCRKLLNARVVEAIKEETWQDLIKKLTGQDPNICKHCKKGLLLKVATLTPLGRLSKIRDTS